MTKGFFLGALSFVLPFFLFCSCHSDKGDFVQKTDSELAAMEERNDEAHSDFVNGQYANAGSILKSLTSERTVSRPLYQLEQLSLLLLDEKYDDAHELMVKLQGDFETLFDTKSEEKAQSVWHGEVNKVFKGDSYERSTFYALMALSFIRKQNYEDALRCVKNGLLAEGDAGAKKDVEDYSLLHYLGYLASLKSGNKAEAEEYYRAMLEGLKLRGFRSEDQNGQKLVGHCFEQLKKEEPNVLLVVWTGKPPTVVCLGEFKEKRTIIHGVSVFDAMSVAVDGGPHRYVPNSLADLDYQATTRGGRLMDNVLADQAAAKSAMKTSGNLLIAVGIGLMYGGIYTMGPGLCCLILGGCVHVVGAFMNPTADGRYWHNIPGQFFIVPLSLSPGRHQVTLNGYDHSDLTGMAVLNVDVKAERGVEVIHLPMLTYGSSATEALESQDSLERQVIDKADADRMAKEIK